MLYIFKSIYKSLCEIFFYLKRYRYLSTLKNLIGKDTSIISSNCFAGRVMQDLGMQYNSPTLGLYIMYPDYLEFLSHLKHYLTEAKIEFQEHSKYTLGDYRRNKAKHWYPIGLLDDKVEIHFLHYHTEEDAANKWYRRAARVNFDNLLVIGMEQNRCDIDDIYTFDNLPFKNKIMFSSKKIASPSNVFIQRYAMTEKVGDPYKEGHVFYKYLARKLKENKLKQAIDKKKILFFLMSAVGGAERMTVTFAKQLDREKYDVTFCILEIADNKGIEEFIGNNYKMIHIPYTSFGLNLKLLSSLYNVLKEEKPDFVFASLISINFRLLLFAGMFKQTKFIVRNNIYLASSSIYQKTLMRMTYPKAVRVIAQTDEMKEELDSLLKCDKEKVVVIQNPIDEETILKKLSNYQPFMHTGHVNYVAVGRFAPSKGFDVLVKAFNNVCKKEPYSVLYIVGRYDEQNSYFQGVWKWVKEHGIQDKIHLVGFNDNPYRYMKNADCFVLSSRNEGLPNVLIEALYIGTPVAACTCIPVIERIVNEGKTGYLAKPEDAEELADAMMKACKLGRVKSTYKASSIESLLQYFN